MFDVMPYRRLMKQLNRLYSTLAIIKSVPGSLCNIDIEVFRNKAFNPEIPVLFTATCRDVAHSTLPAAHKWFITLDNPNFPSTPWTSLLSHKYLAPHAATILPYELTGSSEKTLAELLLLDRATGSPESRIRDSDCFHSFNAPLSLLFHSRSPGLYVAQASLADLPSQLQLDLPTPEVVKKAGRGDVYGSNLWIGNPPTYSPLHKDPNPNFFVQLAGRKQVRLCNPSVGFEIFKDVQKKTGQENAHNGSFRGKEMMEGIERVELEEAVWGANFENGYEGIQAELGIGDCLFIPKGWWHSIRSFRQGVTGEVTASVNWWFR